MKNITFKTILCWLEEIIASCFFIATTVLVVVNVFTRYVLHTGIYWSEEVATGCFVWSVFIGAAACYKRRGHVGVDVIVNMLPQVLQNLVKILVDVILVALTGYMAYISFIYISLSYTKPTPVLGISSAAISSSLTVSFVLMFIYSVIFVFRDLRSIQKHGKVLGKEEN